MKGNFREKFVDVGNKNHRRMLTKLRKKESAHFAEIEDVEHFLLRCGFFSEEQKALLAQMQKVGVEMDQKDDTGKIATILGVAVKEAGVVRILEGMWDKRFLDS